MYLLYVDESGDIGNAANSSTHLVLGGAALFEGIWRHVAESLRTLMSNRFPGIDPLPEIHARSILPGKDEYRALTVPEREAFLRDACRWVTRWYPHEVVLFFAAVDKQEWFHRHPGRTGEDLYAELFEQISNRFDLFLRRRHARGEPSKGVLIADPHKPALTKLLKKNHDMFQRQGTRWNPIYNLVETVFFLGSHESPGLQMADLCAYGVWRLIKSDDDRIVSLLADRFDREPLDAQVNPGKWHGVKFIGSDPAVLSRIERIWPH